MLAACLASRAALERSGAIRMAVVSPMRSVTAPAAASAMSDSWLPYTTRSIVPSAEKPASSLALAQSSTSRRLTPGMVVGRPMPMSMHVSVLEAARARTLTSSTSCRPHCAQDAVGLGHQQPGELELGECRGQVGGVELELE